ncbi:MAG TPA: hypothetical protein VL947_04440, partial [Cytophagales bacterium]|nr:hypothetical protein [Cytophagales bacterium]
AFKTLYASLKQERVRENAQRRAIKNIYYNGCIGNSNFDVSAYGFSDQVSKQVTVTGYRHCNWWQSLTGCTEGTFSFSLSVPYVASTDPAQYCSNNNAAFYKEKTQRFWQEPALGGNITALNAKNCFDTLRIDAVTLEYIPVRCPEDVQALEQELRAENNRKIYMECGVCPLIWDLEHFLGNMAKTQKLTLPTADLSCPPAQGVETFTSLLERSYVSESAALSTHKIQYASTLSSDGKALGIKFIEEGGTVPSQSQIVLTIPSASQYTFSQLTDICCIQVLASSDPNLQGKMFSAMGRIKVLGLGSIEVPIQGMSTVALSPCTIPMRCLPSTKTIYTLQLLNALRSNMNGKANQLLSATAVDLIASNVYNTVIRQLEDKSGFLNNDPLQGFSIPNSSLSYKWSSALSSSKLVGTIQYQVTQGGNTTSGSRLIELSPPIGIPLDFTKVVNFSNIKMKKCTTEGCLSNTFTVDAQLRNTTTGEMTIVKLDGNTSYVMGNCKQAIVFENAKK